MKNRVQTVGRACLKDAIEISKKKRLHREIVMIMRDGEYVSGTLNYFRCMYGDAIMESETEYYVRMGMGKVEIYIREPIAADEGRRSS